MTQPQPVKTWIPVDVKIHWFSFLSAEDLSRASRVCKPWASLVQKTSEVLVATTIGAPCPNLSRAGKLLLLRRLQNATKKENMGYLLAWAAGCREYTPFLHKLLLLRDALREDCGLPGGLHESARPDAYAEVDEEVRALFTYRTGPAVAPPGSPPGELPPGVDLVATPPLVVAAQRGNVDALNLLLLFGEGVGARRKNYLEKALYAAAEQGNVASVACLLGRIPLRPPSHPHHIARTLGLLRPTFPVYGPGNTYSPGVAIGPRSVAAAIAGAKMRAETASATGSVTGANGTVRASMSNAMSLAEKRKGGGGSSSSNSNSRFTAFFSPVEAQVVTMEVCEADGRYREWCKGYFMGGYWSCYDTSLANWEALHGALGGALEVLGSIEPTPAAGGGGGGGGEGAPPLDPVAAALAAGDAAAVAAAAAEVVFPNGAPPLPPKKRHTKAAELTLLGATTLANLPQRLQRCIAPGSTVGGSTVGVTPPYATTALIVSRLPPNLPLSLAVKPRKAGHIPPPIPPPIDYGRIAAEVVGIKVRLNTGGPVEGRTPLNVAVERGRLEIALLLLSHADPGCVERGDIPQLLNREGGGGAGEGGAGEGQQQQAQQQQQAGAGQAAAGAGAAGGAAPAAAAAPLAGGGGGGGGGNPALQGGAAAPPPLTGTALLVSKARRALSDLAAMNSSALAVSYGDLAGSPARREELFSELMETRRDVADPDASPSGYHTPLCLACLRGDDRLVGLLLHWGADVNKEGKKEARPLLCAAMGGHEHILRLLLRVTCDPQESRKVLEQVERLSLRFGGNGSTALAITPAPSAVEWWNPASSSNRGGGASSPRGGFSLSGGGGGGGATSPNYKALRLVPYRGGRVVCSDKVESVAVEEAVKGTPLIGPRCIPYATPLAAQHILLPPAMNTGLEGFTQSLGLGVNAASVLDLALLRTRKERGEEKTTGGTAASNAMGSTVAAQSGRGGGRGGGMSSGGGGGGDEDLAKPEDTPLDTAEPTITLLLAALASGTPGAIDDLGLPLIGKPSPYDASLYLPCEEAQLLPPTALSFVDIACMLQGVPTPSAVVAASAGTRPKPLTFAQRALGKGAAAGGGGGAEEDGGGTTPLVHPDAIGGGLTIANITAVAGNSFPSYLALSVAQARLKMALRSTAHWLLSKSRVLQGCGNTPGRGAPLMVDVGDESGYSALFILACAGKLESVALLVSAGADCCAMTKRGKTPIYGAVEKGHTDVVEWLLTKYTANQLRANTTYGTNVLHAAQKAGNSRIKDLVQTYCVEYDVREARKLKQERESNKATDGEEAANHMKKLRAMAEAAKKREEDSKLGRRWGASGGGGGEGGDEDRPHSASRRGRSVEPKLLTPAAASASALVSAARSASVAPAAKSSQHRAGGGGATPLPPIGVLRGRSMGGEGQDVATPSSRAGSADSRKGSSSSSSGGGGANAKGGNGMRSVSAARRNASEGGKVVGGGVSSSGGGGGSNKPPTSRPPPASLSAPAPSSPRPGFPSTAAMAGGGGGGGGGGAFSPKAKFTASLPPSLASLLTQSAMEESRVASSIAAASHSQVVASPSHSPLSPPPASSTTAAAAANSSSSSSFNALNTSLPGSTSRLVLSPEATHTAPSSSSSGGGGGGGAAGSSPSSVYDRLMGKAKELEQKRKSAEEELVKKAQAQASTNGMTSKAGLIPAAVVAVTAATSPPPSTSTHHAYPPRGGSAGAAALSMGGLTLEGSALVGGNMSGGGGSGGGLIPVAAKVVSVSKPTLTPAAAAAAAAAALVAGAASKLSSASARIQPEVPSAATRGRRVSTTSSTPTSRGSSEGVAAPRIPGLKLGSTASASKPLAIIPPSLAPPPSSSAPPTTTTTTIKSTPSSPSKSGSGKTTFSSGADVRAAARSENATAPTMSTAEEVRSKRSAFLEKLGAVVPSSSSTTNTTSAVAGGGGDAAATTKGGSARAPSPMRAPTTTTPSAFSAGEQAMATAAALRLKRLEGSMNAAPGGSSEDITSSSSSSSSSAAAASAAATYSSSSALSVLESMGAAPGSPVARVLAAAKVQIGEGAKRRSAAAAAAAASSSSGNSSSTSSKSAMLGAALGLSLGATGTALSLRALPTPPPLPTREEISARDERIRQREEKAAATRNAVAAAKAAEAEAAAKALAVSNMVNSLKSAVSLYGGGKAKAKASNY